MVYTSFFIALVGLYVSAPVFIVFYVCTSRIAEAESRGRLVMDVYDSMTKEERERLEKESGFDKKPSTARGLLRWIAWPLHIRVFLEKLHRMMDILEELATPFRRY